jgi:hypothetical protein
VVDGQRVLDAVDGELAAVHHQASIVHQHVERATERQKLAGHTAYFGERREIAANHHCVVAA